MIINKHSITVGWLNDVIEAWKKGQREFSIRLLLRIAVLFNVNPSLLLSSENLESQIQLHNLRTYVSEEDLWRLSLSINLHLQNLINQSEIAVEELAIRSSMSPRSLAEIFSLNHIPMYTKLTQILEVLNISIIDFFKGIESSTDFNIQEIQYDFRHHLITPWENQRLRSIRKRVKDIIGIIGIDYEKIMEITGIAVSLIDQRSFFFSSLFRLANVAHITIAALVDSEVELNSSLISSENIIDYFFSEKYLNKIHQVLIYLIKIKMVELDISLPELALKSGLKFETLKGILSKTRRDLKYLNLVKIVEKGFEIKLADFLVDFEEYIEQFDDINFNVQLPDPIYKSQKVQENLEHLQNRAMEVMRLTGLPTSRLRTLLRMKDLDFLKNRVTVLTLLGFVHIFGITVSQLAGDEDMESLMDPNKLNFKKLPELVITDALKALAHNIQEDLRISNISLSELQIRTGTQKLIRLNPILNGGKHTTIRKSVEVAVALDKSVAELFEGVSTF